MGHCTYLDVEDGISDFVPGLEYTTEGECDEAGGF